MIVVAPTGVAAINAEGVTIHSFFSLPFTPFIPKEARVENENERQYRFSRIKIDILRSLDLLVIDEISMVRADILDAIDEVLRRYKNRNKPFGGVQLLMIGDLQQLPPVVTDADSEVLTRYYDTNFFYGSRALGKTRFVTVELQHIYRQSEAKFIGLLNAVRDNQLSPQMIDLLRQRTIPGFQADDYIMILSVPALAKNFRKNIENGVRAQGKSLNRLFHLALKMAYIYNQDGWNKGAGWRCLLKPLVALFDNVLFSKLRESFGGNLQFFIGGGALLDKDLQQFYYAIGIPMFQGYGLSEATPIISSNGPVNHKFGSSGVLVQPLDIKILDNDGKELPAGEKGEIVIRGENVMAGYWKNPVSTADTVKEGWLYTGDMNLILASVLNMIIQI